MNYEMTESEITTDSCSNQQRHYLERNVGIELAILCVLMCTSFLDIEMNVRVGNMHITTWNPQSNPLVLSGLALVFLLLSGSLRKIGFRFKYSFRGYLWRTGLLTAMLILVDVITSLLTSLLGLTENYSAFKQISESPFLTLFLIFIFFPVFAFLEEFYFRGYLIQRFETLLGNRKAAPTYAVVISSVLFGLVHWHAGPIAAVGHTFSGLVLALIYVAGGRNIWLPSFVHYLVNIMALIINFSK